VARGPAPLIPLGYGKFVRADRIYALVPLEGDRRGDGRRTLVHVEGMDEPLVASRSEAAIARDLAAALAHPEGFAAAAAAGGRAGSGERPGQAPLF
jgi:hypothetical protein